MKKAIIICVFLFSSIAYAQDMHLSQFNASPQNLNPAQTGLFDGDWRFAGNYRSQWAAVPVPYKTFSLSADTRIKKFLKKDVLGAGLVVNNDKSGTSHITTTNVALSLSYIKKLTKDSMHFISVGLQPGVTTKNFDESALTFDSQYDGDAYNAGLPSGENFTNTRATYFDLGGGVAYLFRKNQRTQANVGVSAFHINQPKEMFFNSSTGRVELKTTVSALVEFPISAEIDVLPTFLYQHQVKYNETVAGAFGKYYLKPVNGASTAVSLGILYRVKDAIIIAGGMDYRNFKVGVSYDINTSKFVAATNHRGGFEISIIYIFKKYVPFVAKKRVCPVYM
jgi:type IX secretion system PorP/SprF family membrane protein